MTNPARGASMRRPSVTNVAWWVPWLLAACRAAPTAAPMRAPADVPAARVLDADVAAVDAAVAPPLRFDRVVRVDRPDTGALSPRVLLVPTPGAEEPDSAEQFVPMLCYDAAARRVVANPQCASRVRVGAAVTFPDGAAARVSRAASVACEFHAGGARSRPRQPGYVLARESGALGTFAVWPSGVAAYVVSDAAAEEATQGFDALPAAERTALKATLRAAVRDEVVQALALDLDGDGRDEHVYSLSTYVPAPEDQAQPPDASICVVPGADPSHPSCFSVGGLRTPRVVAAIDFDGDASLELLLYVPGNDFLSYALWRRGPAGWVELGTNNCPGVVSRSGLRAT